MNLEAGNANLGCDKNLRNREGAAVLVGLKKRARPFSARLGLSQLPMDSSSSKLAALGRTFVAVALIGYGVQFFIYAHTIGVLSQTWPAWLGGAPLTEYLAGALLVSTGTAILAGFRAEFATVLLGSVVLLWILGLTLPPALAALANPAPRNNVAESAGICGAILAVAQSLARRKPRPTSTLDITAEKLGIVGRFLFALGLIIFGIEHLIYAEFVATLVPAWIPWHFFWAEFCGYALLAGAVAITFNVLGCLGATLTGVMIALFGLLVNGPRAFAAWNNPDEWTSLFHTLAWSGGAFVFACLLRKVSVQKNAPTRVISA